jgi:hypothetical protein
MATDSIVGGLFSTPEQYQQQRQDIQRAQAIQMAQLDPFQQGQANIQMGVNRIADVGAGALGVQDPQLQLMAMRKQVLQGLDPTDAASINKAAQTLAQAGDQQGAMQLAQKALEIRNTESQISGRTEEKQAQRAMLMQQAAERNATQLEAVRLRNEAMIEAAKERGATQQVIAQMQIDSRNQIAQLAAAMKTSQPKNLPPSLQKDEGKDLETIDTYTGQVEALKPALDALTPDAKGARKLELGPLKNLKYAAQLAAGNSSPEARSYEGLKSAVDTAVNLQVSAEKGVQTDKDVLRFAGALIAAYGRNDTEATYQALKRYQESIVRAQERAKNRVESRRKSQGVDPYYVGNTAASSNNADPLGIRK